MKHVVSVFFDIKKSGDITWRHGILRVLNSLGFRNNLPLFTQSFLTDRTFRVRVHITLYPPFPQEEGASQHNVLCDTLFGLAINYIIVSLGISTAHL